MPISARILGVDLEPIKPVRGAKTIVDDITTQRCRERLRKESEGSLFDIVLHDGAPNVGGAFATEMYSQVRVKGCSCFLKNQCKLLCESGVGGLHEYFYSLHEWLIQPLRWFGRLRELACTLQRCTSKTCECKQAAFLIERAV
jgi:hypothetical protein